jgi:hypothetical protein
MRSCLADLSIGSAGRHLEGLGVMADHARHERKARRHGALG